jgi:hypothetical protein
MKEPVITSVSHPEPSMPPTTPRQWKYKIVTSTEMMVDARGNRTRVVDRLNQYGDEGWELLSVVGEPNAQNILPEARLNGPHDPRRHR